MKLLFLKAFLLLACINYQVFAQQVNWGVSIDGKDDSNHNIRSIKVDEQSMYTLGWAGDGINYDNDTYSAKSIFLDKYDFDSKQQWHVSMLTEAQSVGHVGTINIDSQGDLVIAGNFNETLTFTRPDGSLLELNPGEYLGVETNDYWMTYVAKFTSDGEFKSAKILGGPFPALSDARMVVHDSKLDTENNLYVIGAYSDVAVFEKGTEREVSLTSKSLNSFEQQSYFFAKYDTNTDLVWIKNITGAEDKPFSVFNSSLEIDSDDNLYVGGTFLGHMEVTDESGTLIELTDRRSGSGEIENSSWNGWIGKFSNDGEVVWAKFGVIRKPDVIDRGRYINEIQIDKDKNVYLLGSIDGSAIFDLNGPKEMDMLNWVGLIRPFLAKYDANGDFIKVYQDPETPWPGAGRQLLCDEDGTCVVGVDMYGSTRVGENVFFRNISFSNDLYCAKYDEAGEYLSGVFLQTQEMGTSTNNLLTAMDGNNTDDLFIAGKFGGEMILGENTETPISISTIGDEIWHRDLFIASIDLELGKNGEVTSIEQNISADHVHSVNPNPVRDQLQIARISTSSSWDKIIISNLNGQVVLDVTPAQGSLDETINVSSLLPGMYLVQVFGQTSLQSYKVVKQ